MSQLASSDTNGPGGQRSDLVWTLTAMSGLLTASSSKGSFFPAHLCGNWKQQLSCSVPVPLGLPRSSWSPVQSMGSFYGALPPSSGRWQCFEAVQWLALCYPSAFVCALVNCSTGGFAERGWTPTLVFVVAASVLCWLGLWDSCLAHLPNGKWHLSQCLLSEGVVSGRWRYWPVSRALAWLNLFCTSAAWACVLYWDAAMSGLLGLEQQSQGISHRCSLAALPKAPNQALGAALASAALEHPTGLSCPLGYQMMATAFSASLGWFVPWCHHSWLWLWLCISASGADLMVCGRVWSGLLFPLCCAPTPSSSSSLFGLVLSAGCQGGEVPCGGCQLLSWHTVLGTVASLAPAV